jgi:hypothetical protein
LRVRHTCAWNDGRQHAPCGKTQHGRRVWFPESNARLIEKVADYLGEIHESPHKQWYSIFCKTHNAVVICDIGMFNKIYILEVRRSVSQETNGCLNKFVDKTISDTMRKHTENLCQPQRTSNRKNVNSLGKHPSVFDCTLGRISFENFVKPTGWVRSRKKKEGGRLGSALG